MQGGPGDELYEVLLVDGGVRWHAGWLSTDAQDRLLRDGDRLPVWSARAGLEQHAAAHRLDLVDDTPDEVDLDLGGWLPAGEPLPTTAEVGELWRLLVDEPEAGRPLRAPELAAACRDLDADVADWHTRHAVPVRRALAEAVRLLRDALEPR